jgi:unsaturated rhamnogalacturonyl hydrolase
MRNAWLLCLGGLWACGSTDSGPAEGAVHDAATSTSETSSGAGGTGNPQEPGDTGSSVTPIPESGAEAGPIMDAMTSPTDSATPPAFDRNAVKAIVDKVAQYQLTQLGANPDNDWINATFYAGLMAAYRTTQTAALLAAAKAWSTAHQWDLHGMGDRPRHGDDQACTQTYDEIFLLDPMPSNNLMIAKGQAAFDGMIAAPQPGRVDWWWCDALFMAPPALARLGVATKQSKYFNFLDTMWFDSKAFLFDPAQNLFWRDSTFKNTDTYWARGNGWVVAGIPRVLDYLPANDAKRADYILVFKSLVAAIAKLQGTDGLWRSNLLHANAFPNPETSGSGFFTFGMAWGIANGVLDRAQYLPAVQKGWNGLVGAVDANGRLGYVQNVGAAPAAANATETHPYGVGAFLLAGEQIIKL